MSNEVIKDLESKGFLLVKKAQLWLAVLVMLIGGIAQVVLAFNMLSDHEERIIILEEKKHEIHDSLNEIKYNLKNFIETNGQKYIELK